MNKSGIFKNLIQDPVGGYNRKDTIQYHISSKGNDVSFYDNEGYSMDLGIKFEDLEKIYNSMKSMR